MTPFRIKFNCERGAFGLEEMNWSGFRYELITSPIFSRGNSEGQRGEPLSAMGFFLKIQALAPGVGFSRQEEAKKP